MKSINLFSFVEANNNFGSQLFSKLMERHGVHGTKPHEIDCINSLVDNILKVNYNILILDGYYLGYSIPQIKKEFDLLRFGEKSIINIEVKRESDIEKISKQQNRNYYYLSFLQKEIHIYTYIKDVNKLYKLITTDGSRTTEEVTFTDLYNSLSTQVIEEIDNINDLFEPSNYLVSPFNSTEEFINDKYFLTAHQEEIYKNIEKNLTDTSINFMALTGGAGTGKTLLTYHIAKRRIEAGDEVLILHCGKLNDGHNQLKEQWMWKILMPKDFDSSESFDLIIVDEAQRMKTTQFNELVKKVRDTNIKCIFSYDEKQYLHNDEKNNKIKSKIESVLSNKKAYELKNKIRTNEEIASFIRLLFNKTKKAPKRDFNNIEILYVKDYKSACFVLEMLSSKKWKVINYTPSKPNFKSFHFEGYSYEKDKDNSHSVIGQEFDRVVVCIDEKFHYNINGELVASNVCYSQERMLYQIITRTRKRLCVVVINNEEMLNRCLDILMPSSRDNDTDRNTISSQQKRFEKFIYNT